MKFLFLEPFYGGSHMDFAKGLTENSTHQIDLVTLPSRFWKWRMRGAALYFLNKMSTLEDYDGLITTGLMSLSDFKALSDGRCPPALVYFHENQLTYPLAPGERMDYQFGFTDITTGLAADRILFNSRTHLDDFFSHLPGFIQKMPEFKPTWVVDAIQNKSDVLYPGCNFPDGSMEREVQREVPPIIIWNHRWEFDKNPEFFFKALEIIDRKGIDFKLALLGENYQVKPKPFINAKERFKDKIVAYGHEESKREYVKWLQRGTIVISCAHQENFGISVIEAMRHGCLPLLPNRLSYPEILPREYHGDFIYRDMDGLSTRLEKMLLHPEKYMEKSDLLSDVMSRYSWKTLISQYDAELERLAGVSTQRMQ